MFDLLRFCWFPNLQKHNLEGFWESEIHTWQFFLEKLLVALFIRGLHRFVPRHKDEILVDIGDPVYVHVEAEDGWCEGNIWFFAENFPFS